MDLTLPGYKYLGPFNSINKGDPANNTDVAAYKHDLEYARLLDLGYNPYLYYNQADSDFLEAIENESDYGAIVAKIVFKTKKRIAPVLDMRVGPEDQPVWKPSIKIHLCNSYAYARFQLKFGFNVGDGSLHIKKYNWPV